MKLIIKNKNEKLNAELATHTRHKVDEKFHRFESHIKTVTVRFEDVNGPKGGLDKNCRIEVVGEFGTKITECLDLDFFVAVDRALETAEHAMRRLVERKVLETKQSRRAMNTLVHEKFI